MQQNRSLVPFLLSFEKPPVHKKTRTLFGMFVSQQQRRRGFCGDRKIRTYTPRDLGTPLTRQHALILGETESLIPSFQDSFSNLKSIDGSFYDRRGMIYEMNTNSTKANAVVVFSVSSRNGGAAGVWRSRLFGWREIIRLSQNTLDNDRSTALILVFNEQHGRSQLMQWSCHGKFCRASFQEYRARIRNTVSIASQFKTTVNGSCIILSNAFLCWNLAALERFVVFGESLARVSLVQWVLSPTAPKIIPHL